MGTKEVECLSSYVFRLAYAHGVSRFQLVEHLRAWWARTSGSLLPRVEELRWNGYSRNVRLALLALESATGRDLSPCTLVALSGICAGNCIGSVRHARHWCPACYREDLSARSFVYDRLVWQLQGYERCSIHRHALISGCDKCGEQQRNDVVRASLHLCSTCGADLARACSRPQYRRNPCFGEGEMEALVEKLGDSPRFSPSPLRRYLAAMQRNGADIRRMESLLGDVFHSRHYPVRPQLNSLLAVAVYFGTDVISILSSPEEAACQTAFEFAPMLPKRSKRPFAAMGGKRAEWFRQALKAVVDGAPPYPSLVAFCHEHDYSQSAAASFHAELCRQLTQKRHQWLEACKISAGERAAECARRIHLSSPSLTKRQLAARVAAEADVPIHVSRKVCRT